MQFLNKSEKLILKSYLNMKDSQYIGEFGLKYDMDYYAAISLKMLDNHQNLNLKLEDWASDIKKEMIEYIEKSEYMDNKIYFMITEIILCIAKKYYNNDGTLKDDYKKN